MASGGPLGVGLSNIHDTQKQASEEGREMAIRRKVEHLIHAQLENATPTGTTLGRALIETKPYPGSVSLR